MSSMGTAYGRAAGAQADSRAVFGQVMGLVACTLGFTAGGAYLARNMTGSAGIVFFIAAIVCLIGLHFAARRNEAIAITLLFAFGLLLGLALGPGLAHYVQADPQAVWQAAGATALFTATLGTIGYATKRDLSYLYRIFFFLLLGLLLFGLVAVFISIPHANLIYAVLGLGIFGGYTVLDFNRLRRTGVEDTVPIAAGIFLDVLNVFLFFLQIFGGSRD